MGEDASDLATPTGSRRRVMTGHGHHHLYVTQLFVLPVRGHVSERVANDCFLVVVTLTTIIAYPTLSRPRPRSRLCPTRTTPVPSPSMAPANHHHHGHGQRGAPYTPTMKPAAAPCGGPSVRAYRNTQAIHHRLVAGRV